MKSGGKKEVLAEYLLCLSLLEEKTSSLYQNLALKTEVPLTKSLLLSIAQDSAKHSTLLKGIAESLFPLKTPPKDCSKKLACIFGVIDELQKEITENKKLHMDELIYNLSILEGSLGEEYYILIQLKTLQYMVKGISQLYNVNLQETQDIQQHN